MGQPTAIETLTRALEGGLVHHAYRFEGIEGVGKELTAIAFAQALLCTAGDRLGCGVCDACRRAATFADGEPPSPLHPDLVYVARAFYPPELVGGKREASEISVDQIRRVVLSRADYSPHEGRAQVFIVRDAEQLSISAANALLKTLEEPRPSTHFLLLSARSDKLLDTIRSRSLPIRFGPLADDVLGTLLSARGVPADRIDAILEIAGGSASVALAAADPEQSERRSALVDALMAAVRAPTLADGVVLSESLESDRRLLAEDLRALAGAFAREARARASAAPAAAALAAERHALVLDAIDSVERNGAAALAVTSLIASLRQGRQRRPGRKPPIVVARR